MGRPRKKQAAATPVVASRPPAMKYEQASKLADKNSRTIVKISQLLEILHLPGRDEKDSDRLIIKRIELLKKRLNRRLAKLARWSDCPPEERSTEFRQYVYNGSYNNYYAPSSNSTHQQQRYQPKPMEQRKHNISTSFPPLPQVNLQPLRSQFPTAPTVPFSKYPVNPKPPTFESEAQKPKIGMQDLNSAKDKIQQAIFNIEQQKQRKLQLPGSSSTSASTPTIPLNQFSLSNPALNPTQKLAGTFPLPSSISSGVGSMKTPLPVFTNSQGPLLGNISSLNASLTDKNMNAPIQLPTVPPKSAVYHPPPSVPTTSFTPSQINNPVVNPALAARQETSVGLGTVLTNPLPDPVVSGVYEGIEKGGVSESKSGGEV